MTTKVDVLILGAGPAGLAAARELDRAGVPSLILEARDRVGGRVHTVGHSPTPIELGAEFVHGRPAVTWDLIRDNGLACYEIRDDTQHFVFEKGTLGKAQDFWSRVDAVMELLGGKGDATFDEFLHRHAKTTAVKAGGVATRAFVEGFDAADASRIGTRGLVMASKEEEKIEGDLLFRIQNGYHAVIDALAKGSHVEFKVAVQMIRWSSGRVEVMSREGRIFRAKKLIVTLPLGVLQSGDVTFTPPLPATHQTAIDSLAMGGVIKTIFKFREPFWESEQFRGGMLKDMFFLHAVDEGFAVPTWWTTMPMRSNVLTGWVGGPKAWELSKLSEGDIRAAAIGSLARLLGMTNEKLDHLVDKAWISNWQADPFARGAYSYVPVGASGAMKVLAKPIDGTLFFAGEHTHFEGMSGTVAGAIETGIRAAKSAV